MTGLQFAPGVTTAVAVSGTGIAVTDVAVQSTTTVTATLTIAPDAALGAHAISVTNTGGTGQGLAFTVLPPPPTLDTIDLPVVRAGASAVLTLKGTNFISGITTVAVSGTGLSVGAVSVTDATTLTVGVSASLTAELSAREVTVTTPGGTSAHQFIVIAPPPIVVTNVTGGRLRIGETTTIRISGSGFVPGITTLVSNHPALQVLAVRISNAPASTVPGRARPAFFSASGSSLEADIKALSGFIGTSGAGNVLAVTQNIGSFIASIVDTISMNLDRILSHFGTLFDKELGEFGELEIDIPLVVVPPRPLIAAFEASPSVMFAGESSTLKWRGIEHATTCSLSSIGDVPCADGGIVVSPAATTEYRLTATGSAGDFEWADVTVVVGPRPSPAPAPTPAPTSSATFSNVGNAETFTVPAGVTQVTLEVSGGSGGAGAGSTPSNSGAAGGLGGRVTATVAVTPGETLTVMVGGLGSNAVNGGAFGFGGGAGSVGNGANSGGTGLGGGGGGGASSVRRGSTVLAIAGGGGGGGGNFGAVLGGTGGAGGGAGAAGSGQTTADSGNGGAGATQSAVGTGGTGAGHPGGTGSSGSGRDGGEGGPASNASSGAGGGAGGGAFGGGGGGGGASAHASIHSGGGGGGGSSTTIGSATSVTHLQGVQSGNGSVVIRW